MTSMVSLIAAAGTEPTLFNVPNFIAALLVFVAALLISNKMIWPKITGALDARDAKIRSEIEAAEKSRANADKALKDYESSLAEARAEAEKMIEQTKAEQVRLAADLKAKSEAELNQMRDSAKRNIEAAKRAAIADLYRESAQLAVKIAEKILEREVNAADHSRLIDETLAEVTSEYAGASA
ncbi:MAG: F0F1 ATP synthase subunit B [Phycisphaerales bacterium]|nr:F0F1 ATP synthase subunit B [bacterium]